MARISANGAILEYAAPIEPVTFVRFAYVIEIPTPSITADEFEMTNLDDQAVVIGLGRPKFGAITVRFFMDPVDAAQYRRAFSAQLSSELLWWKISDPASAGHVSATHIFIGKVVGISSARQVNAMVTGDMSLLPLASYAFLPEAAATGAFDDATTFDDGTGWIDP